MPRKLKALIILSLLMPYLYANQISSGLTFHSHQVIKEKRTSLLLNEGKEFYLPDGFTLNFDIKFIQETHNYGYVFRVIGNDTISFDLISNYNTPNKFLSFIEGNKLFIPLEQLTDYKADEWIQIGMKVDSKSNRITLSINDEEAEVSTSYKKLSSFRFQFGYCDKTPFVSYDVPPMTIKNINLRNHKGEQIAFWALNRHNYDLAYDAVKQLPAKADNPIWEIDQHIHWKKENGFVTNEYTQTTYNPDSHLIYFANQNDMLIYNLLNNQIDTLFYKQGNPFFSSTNQLIYNSYTDELISYDLENRDKTVYNFTENSWSNKDYNRRTSYDQHNSFIHPLDSNLYVFGGYKEYTYHNDLLKLDFSSNEWSEVPYSGNIPPRYLAGGDLKNDSTYLLFGGYGNPSGKQHLGPFNYYDLYELNLKDYSIKKLWELAETAEENFVISNEMVVDTLREKIYALCYPNNQTNSYILLRSFNLENGEYEIMGDTIPFLFDDVNSFCTLYHDDFLEKIYALTIYNEHGKAHVNLYSLAYPPLSMKDVRQLPIVAKSSFGKIIFLSIDILIAILIGFLIYRTKRKKNQKKELIKPVNTQDSSEIKEQDEMEKNEFIPIKKSSILFLNGFQVWDKEGNDITREFTPTLKNLLILIILYTQKNEKGVSNTILREILWNDKTPEKAQNNRRVSIQKLKKILVKLEGVEIVNNNTYWAIQYEPTFFSDYLTVSELVNELKNNPSPDKTHLKELLQLASVGLPLPYIHQSWADPFLAAYSMSLQDLLSEVLQKRDIQSDNKILLKIADALLLLDSTDENGLHLKCYVLNQTGKPGQAKSFYNLFCNEYEKLLNNGYSKSFEEVIDSHPFKKL